MAVVPALGFVMKNLDGLQVVVAPLNLNTGSIYESFGRGWLVTAETEQKEVLRFGALNKMKIGVKGNQVTT